MIILFTGLDLEIINIFLLKIVDLSSFYLFDGWYFASI